MKVVLYDRFSVRKYDVTVLFVPVASGVVGIKDGHEPAVWRLRAGELHAHNGHEKTFTMETTGGIMRVYDDGVELCVDTRAATTA